MGSLDDAVALIGQARRIAIVAHSSPDQDAIGSLLGLGLALETVGKRVALLCDDPVPRLLRFLPGSDRVHSALPADFTPDLLVSLDSSDTDRLGRVAQPLLEGGIPVLNVDHHVTNVNYGTVNLVEDRASAAEVLLPLLDALAIPLTRDVATCLLAGVVGDTRSFSTANVTADTLTAAVRLVEAGADLAYVTEMALNRCTVNALHVWGLGLSALQLEDGVLWTAIPLESRRRMGLVGVGSNKLSSMLIGAVEANVAAVFEEQPGDQVEISFRARPGYEVASLALSLGGGGHPLAAGCTLEGSLDEVVQRVVGLLKAQVAQPTGEEG
jgi:phosphoesterase RecJ-like protein